MQLSLAGYIHYRAKCLHVCSQVGCVDGGDGAGGGGCSATDLW